MKAYSTEVFSPEVLRCLAQLIMTKERKYEAFACPSHYFSLPYQVTKIKGVRAFCLEDF